ncbi:transcriptional regulator [Sulfolobus acidocaldarius SUSAZ]|nr:transcriptional regulator [Sulfolobus acidocaldarius SUSAZ]
MVTISDVANLLSRNTINYSIIDYPEKKKSIDIITEEQNDKRRILVLKINNSTSDRRNFRILFDLKKISEVTESLPLIIDDNIEDDVVSEKDGVFSMNLYTLERSLRGEKIFLLKTRGGIFVRVDSKKLRERREEKNMSLGELSQRLGVSRISVYDYEKEDSYVSIEVAEKLIEIFGDEVIGDIIKDYDSNTKKKKELQSDYNEEIRILEKLDRVLSDANYKTVKFNFTAIDMAAIKGSEKLIFCTEVNTLANSLKKFNEANKIASKINAKLLVIAKSSKTSKVYEKENFNVYIYNDIDKVVDESS